MTGGAGSLTVPARTSAAVTCRPSLSKSSASSSSQRMAGSSSAHDRTIGYGGSIPTWIASTMK
jgi:hypothetical protein